MAALGHQSDRQGFVTPGRSQRILVPFGRRLIGDVRNLEVRARAQSADQNPLASFAEQIDGHHRPDSARVARQIARQLQGFGPEAVVDQEQHSHGRSQRGDRLGPGVERLDADSEHRSYP